jgi:hypothetical protein
MVARAARESALPTSSISYSHVPIRLLAHACHDGADLPVLDFEEGEHATRPLDLIAFGYNDSLPVDRKFP